MKEIKNVILCGLGAVGAVYADKLNKIKDINFKVLVDKERFDRYKNQTFLYNGHPLKVEYILPDEKSFTADLIIIATKANGLKPALSEMKNFVGEDTVILPLLNGVTSEQTVAEYYGREHVLYSYFIGHSAVRTGTNITQDGINTIVFGSDNENDKLNVQRVKNFFDKCEINYEIPEDIKRSLWLKFMLNVSSNPTSALLRLDFGQMLSNHKYMDLVIKLMKEVQAIAKAEGINHSESLTEEAIAKLKLMSPKGKTSMLQDVEAGRGTEYKIFTGTICKLGDKHNIETPYCDLLNEFFEIIELNHK